MNRREEEQQPKAPERESEPIRVRIDRGFEAWGRWVADHAWPIIVLTLVATLTLATNTRHVTLDTDPEAFLNEDHPTRIQYNEFKRDFGMDTTVLIAIRSDEIWSLDFLEWLRELHLALEEEVPHVEEVDSLINARLTRGDEDELIVGDLMDPWPEAQDDVERLRKIAEANPMYQNLLIHTQEKIVSIVITLVTYSGQGLDPFEALDGFDNPDGAGDASDPETRKFLGGLERSMMSQAVARVVAARERPGTEIHIVGQPRITEIINIRTKKNLMFFTVLSGMAIMGVLAVLFRRVSGVVLPLLVAFLSIGATFGVAGLRGLPLNVTAQLIPSLLLAVGVSSTIHLLVLFFQEFDRGRSKRDAIAISLGHSALPIAFASITTAGGLVSFNAAELALLQDVGLFAPVGIIVQLFLALTLLPALLCILPLKQRTASADTGSPGLLERVLVQAGDLSTSRPWSVVAGFILVTLVVGFGMTRLHYEFDPLNQVHRDDPVRVSVDFVNQRLKNMSSVEVVIDTGEENGLFDPDLLARIDRLHVASAALRGGEFQELEVGKTLSLVTILKEIHQALNENRPEFYAIPEDKALIAQEMLLFENTGSDDLENFVDSQFSRARFSIRIPYVSPSDFGDFLPQTKALVSEILGPEVDVLITGQLPVMTVIQRELGIGLRNSYSLALLIITCLMMLLIGSVRGGLLSMLPNVLPIAMVLGIMGWIGLELSAITMMVGCVALGLAVDDTIHFFHQFYRYNAKTGDVKEAVRQTMRTTGQAMLVTTIVLALGFAVFMLADLRPLEAFGFVTTTAIILALVTDILLAPALLTLLTRVEATPHRGLSNSVGKQSVAESEGGSPDYS